MTLNDDDYRTLAAVREELRKFSHFTEGMVKSAGLTPRQHQVLVALRGAEACELTIGQLAATLMLKQHSVSGLVDRLQFLGLVERVQNANDRRSVILRLTEKAKTSLGSLSLAHRDELRRIRPLLISLLSQLE